MPKRKHIPALSPEKLQIALQQLDALKISPAAKRQLKLMIQTAANPDNDKVEAIIKTLPKDRQQQIQAIMVDLTRRTTSITNRATQALTAIPDDEWDRLVEEANSGN